MTDYANNVGEDDLTHLPEILALHDLSRDEAAGTPEQFHQRCLDNISKRAIHHHVFDTHTAPCFAGPRILPDITSKYS